MPNRAKLVGPIALVGASLCILLASCGSDSSSTDSNSSSEDGGGGDGGPGSFNGNNDGGEGGPSAASGAPTTCIVGTQGCLCDSTGGCAPNLTCTPQEAPRPSLCCKGSDCTSPSGGSIGKSCNAPTGAQKCTPGVTIPAATGGNDSCGYAATSFVESTTLCAINAVGGGTKPAIIQVFYNDEHALTLGCATASSPVSPLSTDPGSVKYPQTGDPACADAVGRPLRPVVYITDISVDPTCKAGDLQQGGPAYDPVAVFGTWKSATADGTPLADPKTNGWDLTSSADPVPAAAMKCKEGYGAEVRYEVGLISGHSYRIQVVVHDGDQNKGGDSGEACAVFCAGSGSLCEPGQTECADGTTCPTGTVCVQGCCLSSVK